MTKLLRKKVLVRDIALIAVIIVAILLMIILVVGCSSTPPPKPIPEGHPVQLPLARVTAANGSIIGGQAAQNSSGVE